MHEASSVDLDVAPADDVRTNAKSFDPDCVNGSAIGDPNARLAVIAPDATIYPRVDDAVPSTKSVGASC